VLTEQSAVPLATKHGEQPALAHPKDGSVTDSQCSLHALNPAAHWPLSSLSTLVVKEHAAMSAQASVATARP
jgi:hypothetical protein